MTTTLMTRSDRKASSTIMPDTKLEVVVIPVADVARSKQFYEQLDWRVDADFVDGDHFHLVQLTPPGSSCSVIFGKNATPAEPGSAQGLYLVVSDIEQARAEMLRRGVEVSEIFHGEDGTYVGHDEPFLFGSCRAAGPDPERRTYRSYASFKDPDGNGWLLQEVTSRLPGRIGDSGTTFASVSDLANALRRAATAHNAHEARVGGNHSHSWPEWYADFLVSEQHSTGPVST